MAEYRIAEMHLHAGPWGEAFVASPSCVHLPDVRITERATRKPGTIGAPGFCH